MRLLALFHSMRVKLEQGPIGLMIISGSGKLQIEILIDLETLRDSAFQCILWNGHINYSQSYDMKCAAGYCAKSQVPLYTYIVKLGVKWPNMSLK